VETAGDAIARFDAIEADSDQGLHGGTVAIEKRGALLNLSGDELIEGVPVSGTVALSPAPSAEDGQTALATLTVSAPGVGAGSFTATWTTSGTAAMAQVSGQVAGVPVAGTLPAP
jgi:hypothetical protein